MAARLPMLSALLCAASAAAASETGRGALAGTWGTEAQCSGQPILPGGSWRAAAYRIEGDWLQHGDHWCLLRWFETAGDGTYFAARAICGEDSVQSYALGLHLRDGGLTLIWDDRLVTGPLERCAGLR